MGKPLYKLRKQIRLFSFLPSELSCKIKSEINKKTAELYIARNTNTPYLLAFAFRGFNTSLASQLPRPTRTAPQWFTDVGGAAAPVPVYCTIVLGKVRLH